MITITCPFYIKTSHDFSDFDFRHGNTIEVTDSTSFKNLKFSDINISSITIEKDGNNFLIKIVITERINNDKIKLLLFSIANRISFFMNLSEQAVNPHHGTFYVDMDLFKVNVIDSNRPPEPSLKMGMKSGVKFNLSSIELEQNNHEGLLDLFYEGARSELPKSKYFHWFLIMEHLEKSENYKRQYESTDSLFSEEEKSEIKKFAETMDSDRKKDIILGALQPKYTKKNREEKMYHFLDKTLCINLIKVGIETKEVDKNHVKDIIGVRHSLFHTGKTLDEKILWFKLYPLVVEVLKKLIIDKVDIN